MTRIKLTYPKIPDSKNCPNTQCIAFEKYDGTNLHWVWNSELKWYAFGTRRDRFDLDEMGIKEFQKAHPGLEIAPDIFLIEIAPSLDKFFRENPDYYSAEITVFTEFLGENSFAGQHKTEDKKQLILFDVEINTGIIPPQKFITDFRDFPIAKVIYQGKITGKFIDDVRQGKYNLNEGVVCKGVNRDGSMWMAKIKTYNYMQKLQQVFQQNWLNYWE